MTTPRKIYLMVLFLGAQKRARTAKAFVRILQTLKR
jgi:hypothetical protein